MELRKKQPSLSKNTVVSELYDSWWVVLVLIFISMLYLKTHEAKDKQINFLASKLESLENEKLLANNRRDKLLLEIQSLQDPDYVEMLLIKEMGVVPQDSIQVRFKNRSRDIELYSE